MCSIPTEYGDDAESRWKPRHGGGIQPIEGGDDEGVGLLGRVLQLVRGKGAIIGVDPDVVALAQQVDDQGWKRPCDGNAEP
jgi:hypothetical protein